MMTASAMMKIQVPAYCPFVSGVHSTEKRGVWKETKNVIAISAMLIDISECDIDIDDPVDVAIDMPVVVAVDMDIVMSDISDISILAIWGGSDSGNQSRVKCRDIGSWEMTRRRTHLSKCPKQE